MDDKTKELEQAKAEYIDKQKRLALLDVGIDYNDVSTYVKYINAEDEAEIKQQAEDIAADIDGHTKFTDGYQAPRGSWTPFK